MMNLWEINWVIVSIKRFSLLLELMKKVIVRKKLGF